VIVTTPLLLVKCHPVAGIDSRPLSHRIPPPAGSVPRRRKKIGALPGQPKFMDAAAVLFLARRGASEKSRS